MMHKIGSSALAVFILLFGINSVFAQSCSNSDDCDNGEICVSDATNPIQVEECFLWIFCDSYTLYPLVCQEAPEEEPEPAEDEELVIACINDIAVVRGFCLILRYFIDPDSIEDIWQELADTWVFGRRAEE